MNRRPPTTSALALALVLMLTLVACATTPAPQLSSPASDDPMVPGVTSNAESSAPRVANPGRAAAPAAPDATSGGQAAQLPLPSLDRMIVRTVTLSLLVPD